jgi:hypothetical protein
MLLKKLFVFCAVNSFYYLFTDLTCSVHLSVISNKLDGHMLQIIARCAAHDAQTGGYLYKLFPLYLRVCDIASSEATTL